MIRIDMCNNFGNHIDYFAATWIKPQLAALVKAAPDGLGWLHEIKFDGYRMHARLDAGRVNILTRKGNDWTAKYPAIAEDIARLPAKNVPGRRALRRPPGRPNRLQPDPECQRYRPERLAGFLSVRSPVPRW